MPILMSSSSHRSCKMEALVEGCPLICFLIYCRENSRHLTLCMLKTLTWPSHWPGLLNHEGILQAGQKLHTVKVEGSFDGSLCRELLSCVCALLAMLLNINVVVRTWRIGWTGQQLQSMRSPSTTSLHTMNFSAAEFSFDRDFVLVF